MDLMAPHTPEKYKHVINNVMVVADHFLTTHICKIGKGEGIRKLNIYLSQSLDRRLTRCGLE